MTRDLLSALVYVCVQVGAAARGVTRDRAWQQEQLPRCCLHTGSTMELESTCRRHHERGAVASLLLARLLASCSCTALKWQNARQRRGIHALQINGAGVQLWHCTPTV